MHLQFKLRRWGIAILLSAPELIVGGWMHVEKTLCQRHLPDLEQAMSGNPFRLVAFEGSATVRSPSNGVSSCCTWRVMVSIGELTGTISWISVQRLTVGRFFGTKLHGTLSSMRIRCFTGFHGVSRTLSRTNTSSRRSRHNRLDDLKAHAALSLRHW